MARIGLDVQAVGCRASVGSWSRAGAGRSRHFARGQASVGTDTPWRRCRPLGLTSQRLRLGPWFRGGSTLAACLVGSAGADARLRGQDHVHRAVGGFGRAERIDPRQSPTIFDNLRQSRKDLLLVGRSTRRSSSCGRRGQRRPRPGWSAATSSPQGTGPPHRATATLSGFSCCSLPKVRTRPRTSPHSGPSAGSLSAFDGGHWRARVALPVPGLWGVCGVNITSEAQRLAESVPRSGPVRACNGVSPGRRSRD